jgi:BolA protein
MSMANRITRKLETLSPLSLKVVDDSGRHAGHVGARPGGETHFTVEIVAPVFAGLGRVQRHRLVHEMLAAELADGVHALSLVLRAPDEV